MGQAHPILILGSTGHVGRALAAVWPDAAPVIWQHRPGAMPPAAPALCWDMLNAPAPDLPPLAGIVQLAGGTAPAQLAATVPLAQAACDLGDRLGVPVLVASSQAVYGPQPGPVDEATPCDPRNDYGRAKCAMEAAVAGRACALRIGNVVGCDMLLRNAARGRVTLDRLPDGTSPRRAYVGPATLGAVLRALIAHPGLLPGVINAAQPGTVEMQALLQAAETDFDWQEAGAGVLPVLELDVTLLQGLVPLPRAEPASLIAEARAAGWGPA